MRVPADDTMRLNGGELARLFNGISDEQCMYSARFTGLTESLGPE